MKKICLVRLCMLRGGGQDGEVNKGRFTSVPVSGDSTPPPCRFKYNHPVYTASCGYAYTHLSHNKLVIYS